MGSWQTGPTQGRRRRCCATAASLLLLLPPVLLPYTLAIENKVSQRCTTMGGAHPSRPVYACFAWVSLPLEARESRRSCCNARWSPEKRRCVGNGSSNGSSRCVHVAIVDFRCCCCCYHNAHTTDATAPLACGRRIAAVGGYEYQWAVSTPAWRGDIIITSVFTRWLFA